MVESASESEGGLKNLLTETLRAQLATAPSAEVIDLRERIQREALAAGPRVALEDPEAERLYQELIRVSDELRGPWQAQRMAPLRGFLLPTTPEMDLEHERLGKLWPPDS
jgi:hypothetical protein